MSLIELMIALVVLVVGMLAAMTLVTVSVATNNRNKLDTTGTMLAQTVLEAIASQPASVSTAITINDCNPAGATAWTIATAGAAYPGAGANVNWSSTGDIDFTQSYSSLTTAFPNNAMKYVACGVSGQQSTYDVRWNVLTLTSYTKLITVSARQIGAQGGKALFFSPPITLRTISGN